MAKIKRLVLDVAKPQEPSIVEFAKALGEVNGVEEVSIVTKEVDRNVENVRMAVKGNDMDADEIMSSIEKLGASIQSTAEVEAIK